MTCGTRSADSTSNQCQNVTIHNVSTIKLTKSLNARASADDDRKDTDLSSQAEVDTVDETEDSESTGAGGRTGSTGAGQGAASGTGGTKDDTQARESDDGQKDQEDNADGTADTAGAAGSSSDSSTGAASDAPAGSEPAADVLVLAAAPGREGAEAPEILLEGLESPSSDALEGLDIDALVALLPSLGFSGTQDSVVRLPAPAVTTTSYHGPTTILVVGVGTGWADTDPLAVTADDDQRLDVLVWSVSQKGAASTTRLFIRAAAHVEHLVPGLAQEPAGDVVGSRMTAASGGGIGQQGYTHEGTDAKVRKNG